MAKETTQQRLARKDNELKERIANGEKPFTLLGSIQEGVSPASMGKVLATVAVPVAISTTLPGCTKPSKESQGPNNNNNTNQNTDVSSITVGRVMPYYAKAGSLSSAQSASAGGYSQVFVQPGFTNSTYGFGPFTSNAVGYMSGISLVSKSLSTSASTFVPAGSVLDLEGRVNAIPNGWLKHNGKKVATTFSAGNVDPAYMADIRIEAVQDAFVEYGVNIGHTYGQGAVVDEADQALYFSESNPTGAAFPGLSTAFEEQFRRIAWANYYNYPLDQEFQKNPDGSYKRENGERVNNIEQVIDGGQYKAKNKTTGEIYSPLGHSTEPLSGIQPTGNGNVLTDKMLKYTAYSSCKMTLEARVYNKAGDPTDAAYRNEVTNAILVYARYAKAAGRTIIHISDLEPATSNTAAGYKEAAIETAKYWNDVIKRVENEVGIKVNLNMSIQSTGPGGYFTNDNPQDFIENKNLVNVLKDLPELNGIKVIAKADVVPAMSNPFMPEMHIKENGKADINLAMGLAMNRAADNEAAQAALKVGKATPEKKADNLRQRLAARGKESHAEREDGRMTEADKAPFIG